MTAASKDTVMCLVYDDQERTSCKFSFDEGSTYHLAKNTQCLYKDGALVWGDAAVCSAAPETDAVQLDSLDKLCGGRGAVIIDNAIACIMAAPPTEGHEDPEKHSRPAEHHPAKRHPAERHPAEHHHAEHHHAKPATCSSTTVLDAEFAKLHKFPHGGKNTSVDDKLDLIMTQMATVKQALV